MENNRAYRALISSDWNGCLSPGGPYDAISFIYQALAPDLTKIFHKYTTGAMSLGEASDKVREILPHPLSIEEIDAFIDNNFSMYKGVAELISWCTNHDILFMINTTGMIGYFQRVLAKGLLPPVPILSANPLVKYRRANTDPGLIYDLLEVRDKADNTGKVRDQYNFSANKIVLIGDSGGDGPHFKWGAENGAFLIGSMAKPSLKHYCERNGIKIDYLFGVSYDSEERQPDKEKLIDFMELTDIIEKKIQNK